MTDPVAARGRAAAGHRERWGGASFVAHAPGRVNLIGEHTDYNDGLVLPMAVPFETAIAVSPTSGRPADPSEIESEEFGRARLEPGRVVEAPGWARYPGGVRDLLAGEGVDAPPFRAFVATDLPMGAGLSSSAALEVAFGLAVLRLAGAEMARVDLARLCQRVENEILGVPSGIMDQLISATATQGKAMLIDCRTLSTRSAPLPPDVSVVVLDTGTRRQLVDSAFAARRASCREACLLLGVDSLRDAVRADDIDAEHDVARRRARHVISENARTFAAFAALEAADGERLGALMSDSHRSLRDDYEVSGPALDTMVEAAWSSPGCLGARMTGGGFAGCAVALVAADAVAAFVATVTTRYDAATGRSSTAWVCSPAGGAAIEDGPDS